MVEDKSRTDCVAGLTGLSGAYPGRGIGAAKASVVEIEGMD
jgi:hypothetical protein